MSIGQFDLLMNRMVSNMCGLVGVMSSNLFDAELRALSELIFMDTLRGYDSTGIAAIIESSERGKVPVRTYKKAIPGNDFVCMRNYDKLLASMKYKKGVLMAHNRAATKGVVSDDTAHPFTHNGVTLAHNGTLHNHKQLDGGSKFEVDSEAICWAISQSEDARDVLSKLQGAFALTWYDEADETFNLCRNDQRPLWMASILDYQDKPKGVIWASEPWMLHAVHHRTNIKIGQLSQLKPGVLASYDMNDGMKLIRSEEVALWVPKKYIGVVKNSTKTSVTKTGTTGQEKTGKNTQGQASAPKGIASPNVKASGNILHMPSKTGGNKALPKIISTNDPCTSDYIEFEVCNADFTPYSGGSAHGGFCLGFAYSQSYVYTVRAHSFDPDVHSDGTYRARVVSTSVAEHEVCVGDSNRLIYVSMADAVFLGNNTEPDLFDKNSPDVRRAKLEVKVKNLPAIVAGVMVSGPNGCEIPLKAWENATKFGCSSCQANLFADDASQINWMDSKTPICPDCITNGMVIKH